MCRSPNQGPLLLCTCSKGLRSKDAGTFKDFVTPIVQDFALNLKECHLWVESHSKDFHLISAHVPFCIPAILQALSNDFFMSICHVREVFKRIFQLCRWFMKIFEAIGYESGTPAMSVCLDHRNIPCMELCSHWASLKAKTTAWIFYVQLPNQINRFRLTMGFVLISSDFELSHPILNDKFCDFSGLPHCLKMVVVLLCKGWFRV